MDIFLNRKHVPAPTKWVLVADEFRKDYELTLLSKKRNIKTTETIFCSALVFAKLAGWEGGRRFFYIKNRYGYPMKLVDSMGLWDEEAHSFSSYLKKYMLAQANLGFVEETIPQAIKNLLGVSDDGGFFIHT